MRIFVSHPSRHGSIAVEIAEAIRAVKIEVFLDKDSIPKGESWREALMSALRRGHAYIIVFDADAYRDRGYFYREVEEIIRSAPERGAEVLPVLVPGTQLTDLPPALSERQVVAIEPQSGGAWKQIVVDVCTRWRQRRGARGLKIAAAAGLTLAAASTALSFVVPLAVRTINCEQTFADTEASRLRTFAAEAKQVWVIGQSLTHVANSEEDLLLETIAGKRGGKVRILLMMPEGVAISSFSEWSANTKAFPKQVEHSVELFRQWLRKSSERGLDIEVRLAEIVPFSANFIDWEDPENAALQERPYLFQVSSSARPMFQFSRSCNPAAFDTFLSSMENAWSRATPLSVAPALSMAGP